MAESAEIIKRDSRGRLVKGSAPLPGAGRSKPHREYLAGVIRGILEAPDPTGVSVFERTVHSLLENPDPRIALSTLEFLTPYGYGKPLTPTEGEKIQQAAGIIAVIRAPRPDRSTAEVVESLELSESQYEVRGASPGSSDDREDESPRNGLAAPGWNQVNGQKPSFS